MDNKQLAETISSLTPGLEIKDGKHYTEVNVPASSLHELCLQLRDRDDLKFDYLFCLSGVDYGKELGVVYHLRSTVHNHSVVIRSLASGRENPVLDTVSDIWQAAEYHEREVFDLLGIRFSNHPDLRRFFLDSSWGHPLRKDFVDDINIVTK